MISSINPVLGTIIFGMILFGLVWTFFTPKLDALFIPSIDRFLERCVWIRKSKIMIRKSGLQVSEKGSESSFQRMTILVFIIALGSLIFAFSPSL